MESLSRRSRYSGKWTRLPRPGVAEHPGQPAPGMWPPHGGGDMSSETGSRTIQGIEAPAVGTWEIDPVHTSIAFVARYLMVTKVRGHFSEFSGSILVAEGPEDSSAELSGENSLVVSGDLTIRDVTHPVGLGVEFAGLSQDPWGNRRAGFSATTEIDREEFGASWNLALEAGGWLVSRTVQVELDVLVTLKAEGAS